SPAAGTLVGLGTHTITVTATDEAGNSATCTTTFTVDGAMAVSGSSDVTVVTGQGANFSVSASGAGPFSYQWSKDGVEIGGATGSSYTLGSVSTGDAATYCVVVSGACSNMTNCATLTVNEPTTATGPNDMTLVTGDSGTFSTTPSGTGPFEFQWTHNGVDSPGATNASYTVGPVSPGDAGTYCVIVTGVVNSVTNCATLTVNEPTTAS